MLKKIVLAVTLVLLCTVTSSQLVYGGELYGGRYEMPDGEYCGNVVIDPVEHEAQLREELGDDVYEASQNGKPNDIIWRDLKTGEFGFIETRDFGIDSTEAIIPEGLEIADLPEIPDEPELSTTSVIDPDTRVPVANVNAYPYTASALIYVTFEKHLKPVPISAFFVSDRVLLTAGHCLYLEKYGWATKIEVKPGGNDSSFEKVTASNYAVSKGWEDSFDSDYDYGVIVLDESMNTGSLSLKTKTISELKYKGVINYGYPIDKDEGTLWYGEGTIKSATTNMLMHDVDTEGGNSGSPIILKTDSFSAIAVHTQGKGSGNLNKAVRVTDSLINFVEESKISVGDK